MKIVRQTMACEEVVLTDAECAYLLEQHDAGIDIGMGSFGASPAAKTQKSVKNPRIKIAPSVVATVYCKRLHMANTSIFSKSYSLSLALGERPKTYLDERIQYKSKTRVWRSCDHLTKLTLAATPLYYMAKQRGWELRTFTLNLNEELHDRLVAGDSSALEYIKDEMRRRTQLAIPGVELLFGIERTPEGLSGEGSRRRWHIHGLIIGPKGFAATGKANPLRKGLSMLKGEADSDLMFGEPGKEKNTSPLAGALGWTVYACKNRITTLLAPASVKMYDLAPGKETYISRCLRQEAERWHEGTRRGVLPAELVKSAQPGLYRSFTAKR